MKKRTCRTCKLSEVRFEDQFECSECHDRWELESATLHHHQPECGGQPPTLTQYRAIRREHGPNYRTWPGTFCCTTHAAKLVAEGIEQRRRGNEAIPQDIRTRNLRKLKVQNAIEQGVEPRHGYRSLT